MLTFLIKEATMNILFKKEDITANILATAIEINEAFIFENKNIVVLGVLNGGVYYLVDLTRFFDFDFTLHFIQMDSYKENKQVQEPNLLSILPNIPKGSTVLVVDDIADSGNTLKAIWSHLESLDKDLEIYFTCLVTRCTCNKEEVKSLPNYFTCLTTDSDKYLVGYGLDDNEYLRQLDDIYEINS